MNDNDILIFNESLDDAVSMLDQFGLKLTGIYISFPEAKTSYTEVPFSNEAIDLTELDGNVYYKQRNAELTFDYAGDFSHFRSVMTQLATLLHGKKLKLVDTSDAGYYYIGRLAVDGTKTDDVIGHAVISGLLNPYKYEIQSSMDDWLWDTFDFELGVIREYKDLKVVDTLTIDIDGTGMAAVPSIICSTAMQVTFEGKSYSLTKGTNKIPAIKVKQGLNTLTFKGDGTVSIDYRGGWL